jgi:hypothetical protein
VILLTVAGNHALVARTAGNSAVPVVAQPVGAPPDVVRLGVEEGGRIAQLAELDGRYLSTEVAGSFTGRVVGMYATEGTVAFDWYEYRPDPR